MPDLLKLSRAARLAGVSRGDLQDKVRSGELETFEGKVKITDLVRVYPQVNLDRDPMLEKVQRIKDNARAKGLLENRETELPSAEILLQRLQSMSGLLIETKSRLDYQSDLLATLSTQLGELSQAALPLEDLQAKIKGLDGWLRDVISERREKPEDAAVLFTRNLLLHVIAAGVKLIPSGHEFFVEGGDTILQAAVRKGLHIGYGCNNASCGACKARLISGEVIETQKPAYQLSPHEEQMGYLLMCCNTAVTDLTLEAGEAATPADLPEQEIACQLRSLQPLQPGAAQIQLQVPEDQNFQFFAGQSAALRVPGGKAASLPVISCPCDGGSLQFLLQKTPDNAPIYESLAGLSGGDRVMLQGPFGDFVLDVEDENPTLFIACDSGFAAIKSMIEHGISIDRIPSFYLYRFTSDSQPAYLDNACRAWADSLDNFTYRKQSWQDLSKLDGNAVAANVAKQATLQWPWDADFSELSACSAYVAGPGNFVAHVARSLGALGLPAEQLRTLSLDPEMT